jgi:hypothetical protein
MPQHFILGLPTAALAAAANGWMMIPGDGAVAASSGLGAAQTVLVSPRRIVCSAVCFSILRTATPVGRTYGEGQGRDVPMSVCMIGMQDGSQGVGRDALLRHQFLVVVGERWIKLCSAGGQTKVKDIVMDRS